MMFKDMDVQIKIIVEELAVFKQEVISQRESNIKWMNDAE